MSAKDKVIEQALQLSAAERMDIVEALYGSLDGPPDPDAAGAWSDEIARRIGEIDAGRARMVPWDEARHRIAGDDVDDARASR